MYDEAKRYAEALAMAYHRQQGVDTAIARIFNTYGPRMRPNDGRAVPTFMRQAIEGKPITVFGDGKQTRSFCYVDDLIEGLFRLSVSGEHTPVNLGNPEELTLARARRRPSSPSPARRARSCTQALPIDDPKVRCPDITKADARCSTGGRTVDLRRGPASGAATIEVRTESHSMTGLNGDATEQMLRVVPAATDRPRAGSPDVAAAASA